MVHDCGDFRSRRTARGAAPCSGATADLVGPCKQVLGWNFGAHGIAPMSDPSLSPTPAPPSFPAPAPSRRQTFLRGVLTGIVLVIGGAWIFNRTTLVDYLVTPLVLSDTSGHGDVIVVPGAGASAECSPNIYSIRRVMLARQVYAEGRAPKILISGGMASGQRCAVADAMGRLALQLGVPERDLIVETRAHSTWENAAFSAPILRRLGARRIVIVTDRLHMLRAEACFRHFGFETERVAVPSPASHADNVSALLMSAREAAALAYYWARGRFADDPAALAMPHADVTDPEPVLTSAVQSLRPAGPRHPDGPILILGASYAKGWNLQLAGRPVVNKGVAGQETADLQARFQADVVAQQPSAVIIWGFINDIFRAPPDQVDARSQRALEQTVAMVEAARAAGIEPVLATEVTIRGRSETWSDTFSEWAGWLLGKSGYQAFINRHVIEGNARLRDYATREKLLLLDLQPVLAQADGQRKAEFARPDGSHITAAGYDALSRYAKPILERHFAGR
jgi:uncharacterized SAM-binding protein YcdF (DUF218 family)/lysophospholipase L1-like esterase